MRFEEETTSGLKEGIVDDAFVAHLRRARLDLLPVLYELLKTGSVTKAARALNLTQSAVSQNLRALRAIFNDDLLVPVGRSFQPTQLALSLVEPLTRLLEDAEQLLGPREAFSPANEEMRVVIATADYVCSLLAPRLIEICAQEAPRVTFEFVEGSSTVSLDDLSLVDFFIAPRAYGDTFGKRLGAVSLWRDHIVCVGSSDNPALPDEMTPKDVLQHRQVGYRVNPKIPDRVRRLIHPTFVLETGRICTAPTFAVLGAIAEKSDCVALVPNKLAREMVAHRRLKIIELTHIDTRFEIGAYWSPSVGGKRGHSWVTQLLTRIAREIEEERG